MRTFLNKYTRAAVVSSLVFASTSAFSSGPVSYEVTITNLTNAVNFTPIIVASHRRNIGLYELGSAASDELSAIAESGNITPLADVLSTNPKVADIQDSGGLLGPGQSVTVTVSAEQSANRISIASMILPTNDGFIALNSVKAPKRGSKTYFSVGFDAGTEPNDEWCANIPGPPCGGVGPSPGPNPDDEGYVHVHRGIHGIGDLAASVYDWRNPVAKITIKTIRSHYY